MGELLIDSDRLGIGSGTSSGRPIAEPATPVDLFIGSSMTSVAESIIREVTAELGPQPAAPESTAVSGQTGTA